jgi:hypothetical protein
MHLAFGDVRGGDENIVAMGALRRALWSAAPWRRFQISASPSLCTQTLQKAKREQSPALQGDGNLQVAKKVSA